MMLFYISALIEIVDMELPVLLNAKTHLFLKTFGKVARHTGGEWDLIHTLVIHYFSIILMSVGRVGDTYIGKILGHLNLSIAKEL